MPESKPRKTPSQKQHERAQLQADIDAYLAAGGQIQSAPVQVAQGDDKMADSATSVAGQSIPVRSVPTP